MKRRTQGFTLAELLIVVAIIAVLVAVAIPIFVTRLEQSRETTDIANLRSAYAAGQVAALGGGTAGLPMPDGKFFYDPDDPIALVSSGGKALGQGTVTNGHASISALPSKCLYDNEKSVEKRRIYVKFSGGFVEEVAFEDLQPTPT